MIVAPAFHFDAQHHVYTLGGAVIPSITQLLDKGGLVTGQAFMTEASRDRGTEVHRLCTDYDLGVLDLPKLESPHRGYVLAYVAASVALNPKWDEIEEADVHPVYKFAGRVDRVGTVHDRPTVCEIKSAAKASHHAIQTAAQAILKSYRLSLAPHQFQRLVVYVKKTGRWSVERHENRRDFDTAMRLIKEFC